VRALLHHSLGEYANDVVSPDIASLELLSASSKRTRAVRYNILTKLRIRFGIKDYRREATVHFYESPIRQSDRMITLADHVQHGFSTDGRRHRSGSENESVALPAHLENEIPDTRRSGYDSTSESYPFLKVHAASSSMPSAK